MVFQTAAGGLHDPLGAHELSARPSATAGPISDRIVSGFSSTPPVPPPGVNQVFLPLTVRDNAALVAVEGKAGGRISASGQQLIFEPALVGLARIAFTDRKLNLSETQDLALLLPLEEDASAVDWRDGTPVELRERDLRTEAPRDALFSGGIPASLASARGLKKLEAALADHLYRNQAFTLLHSPTLKLYAKPGETERDFRARVQQAAREARDAAVDKIRDAYKAKLDRVITQKEKEEAELAEDRAQLQGRVAEEVFSGLDSVAGLFGLFGSRRRQSLSGVSRAATKRRMTAAAKADIDESVVKIKLFEEQIAKLKSDMEAEMAATTEQWTKAAEEIREMSIAPKKSDIDVQLVSLAWKPFWEVTYQDARGLTRTEVVPAFT
jgi:hypothetical protein